MNDEESSQSAELNSYHRDIDPGFGAGFGGFVIAHQSPLAHQPAEGSLHDPAAWQDFEARDVVRTFDDRDGQLGAQPFDPWSEGFAGVAAIHPQDAQPGEPAQDPAQQDFCAVAFGGAGGGHGHTQHQPQGVHQQMPLAAFDLLAGVIADPTAVTSRFDTLTVQNGRRWATALAVSLPDKGAQRIIESRPLMVERSLSEDMANRFPVRKVRRQITPRAATFDQIQDGIQNAPPINWRASAFGGFGEPRFEVSPLGIRETGLVYGVFHARTEATLKMRRRNPSRMSTHPSTILSPAIKQTYQPHRQSKN